MHLETRVSPGCWLRLLASLPEGLEALSWVEASPTSYLSILCPDIGLRARELAQISDTFCSVAVL